MNFFRKILTLVVIPAILTVLTFYLQLGLHTNVVLQVYPVWMSFWNGVRSLIGFQVVPDEVEPVLIQEKLVRKVCCPKIRLEGTKLKDSWYAGMMGEYSVFEDLPSIEYPGTPSFPVYKHKFESAPPGLDLLFIHLQSWHQSRADIQ